ncbi:MAG: DUF2723 domain-containing protein [Pseudomonadales bacterium]|nr:DUF2723 domain-containing protein [Pseudomonadales bacterium]MBO6595062.1 DUF2723 domain-containing protein [Pseudomonadales bacterium]MBO6658001.1 DUF2723 domain-containing protein [Pseudomonadales bacterium]MBO6821379.1 DUF2723 domain-containing protein [Pseudomonadales bacterium]
MRPTLTSPALLLIPVVVIPLIAYALTMPGSITLEDAGLFQMVCTQGGLSHPPGYPLFTLACQNLLISDHIQAGNMISAVFGALTIAVFYLLMNRYFDTAIAATAALTYGFSLTFWQQSIIIEVYTLSALLFYLTWLTLSSFVQSRDRHYWFISCFIFGLALSNHWPLMLLATPALIAVVWPILRHHFAELIQPRPLMVALVSFTAGLLPYSTLIFSDGSGFGVFGAVTDRSDFFDYVSRAPYNDHHLSADWLDRAEYLAWLAPEALNQLGIPVGIAALGGLALMIRDRHELLLPSLLNLAGGTIILVLLLGFEFDARGRSIFQPYPIIAWGSLTMWLGYLLCSLNRSLERPIMKSALLIATVAAVSLANLPSTYRGADRWVEDYFTSMLSALPQDAVLFVDGDLLSFPLGYLHFVEKQRTDISLLNWSSLTFPNRLSPAMATKKEKEATIIEFVSRTERPVFVVEPTLAPLTHYGWFSQVNRNPYVPSRISGEAETALEMVMNRYLTNELNQQQEFELADFILASFTRMYIVQQASGNPLDAMQGQRFQSLLATFPGKMVLMQHELTSNPEPNKQMLEEVLADTMNQIPAYLPKAKQRLLYAVADRIAALPDSHSRG